jgi:hypothetical protein
MDARRGEGSNRRSGVRTLGIGVVVALAVGSVAAAGPGSGRGGYGPGGGGGGYNETPTPTPTVTVTPTPTVTPPPPDKTAPVCTTKPVRKQTSRTIRKRGLKLNVRCNEAARHLTQLFVNRSTARKLGIKRKAKKRVLVGKRATLVKANVTQRITVKLNKKAKRGIRRMKRRHVRKLKLTISTSAKDAANNIRRSETTKSFKR